MNWRTRASTSYYMWKWACVACSQSFLAGFLGVCRHLCSVFVFSLLFVQVLGTPTKTQIFAMNRNYTELKFPDVKARAWSTVLTGSHIPPAAIDFVSNVLRYEPKSRLTPLEACRHSFFDHLRQDPSRTPVLLPNRKPVPDHLFTFNDEEIEVNPSVVCQLIPEHARTAENWNAKLKNAWQSLSKSPSGSDAAPAPTTTTAAAAASAAADSAEAEFPSISDSEDAPDKGKE